jgi:hypothetical protein
MDKLVLGFIADVLYVKGTIGSCEYEDIQSAKHPADLEEIVEKMLRGEYHVRKGESYAHYGK